LTAVFRAEPGADTLPVNVGNDGYVWFELRNVVAERDRPLVDVRDRVVADWTADQQRQALTAKATELKARLDKGETLAAIGGELGLAVETKQGLRRNAEDAIFGNEAIAAAFAGPLDTTASALGSDGESRLLMKVTAVDQSPSDALSGDEQLQRMAESAGDDMLDQMVNSLKNSYGVSINQSVVNQSTVQ
jgi:peptidyl-prolyl cis-trans isomerase D